MTKKSWGRFRQLLSSKKRDSVPHSVPALTGQSEPTPPSMKLFEQLYLSVPDIFQGINTLADNAAVVGYDIEAGEEIKKELIIELDKLDFNAILINVAKQLLIFGNAYLEVTYDGTNITSLDFIHPSSIEVKRDKAGNVEKYFQKAEDGTTIPLDQKEIIHFIWNQIADSPYGIGLVQPLLKILTYKLNVEENVAIAADNYANPIQLWKFGRAEKPWTRTKIKAFIDDFKPSTRKRVGVAGDVDFELKAPQFQLKLDYYFEHIENQILTGVQVPDCLLGRGKGTTEAVARVELQGFDRRVQSLRLDMKRPIDTKLFPLIAKLKKWKEEPKLAWPLTNSQEADSAEIMVELVKVGIVSPEFAREKLGYEDPVADNSTDSQSEGRVGLSNSKEVENKPKIDENKSKVDKNKDGKS